jgi:FkbM family methyltransferase
MAAHGFRPVPRWTSRKTMILNTTIMSQTLIEQHYSKINRRNGSRKIGKMKDTNQTLLEIIHHITASHSELRPKIEQQIFQEKSKNLFDAKFLLTINETILKKSKSQLRQDIFVISELNYKRNGYFVEFGATNGIDLSNTYLLETEYGWSGILAEPAKIWHADLERNRKAKIDKRCVWSHTGETLIFNETNYADLSTIDSFSSIDNHTKARDGGKKYLVQTISLMDLLNENHAPEEIDYLSIDTEGSEFEILKDFDFHRYKLKVITCEHNYSPMREKLNALFQKNGYRKKFEQISQFDDWWVLE